MASPKLRNDFRKYHRWLGFFLAGIMAVYASSGILLIFRTTDFLKYESTTEYTLAPGLSAKNLGKELGLRKFALKEETEEQLIYAEGSYNKLSGEATVTKKDYPVVLAKLVSLHKATTNSPLFILNIFFGISLLFFVVSAFVMFMPKALVYKNGLKIAAAGFLFALLVVIFAS